MSAAAYPKINFNTSLAKNFDIPTFVLDFNGTPTFIKTGTDYNSTIALAANQLLFDGQVFVALQANRDVLKAASKQIDLTKETIKANILKICYQLIAAKIQENLLQNNIDNVQRNLSDLIQTKNAGLAEQIDIDKLQVQLENIKFEKRKLNISVSNGYLGLKTLIGLNSRNTLLLTDTLSIQDISDNLLTDIQQFNYQNRHDFQFLILQEKLNKYNLKRYQYSKIPTISLSYLKGFNAFGNTLDFFNARKFNYDEFANNNYTWFKNTSLSISLNVPIFNGLATNSRIAQTKLAIKQVQYQIEQTKIQIDNDIKSFQNSYTQAIENIELQKNNMLLAEKIYFQTQQKLIQGLASQLELYNALIQLQTSQNNYFLSVYTAIVAKIDLQKSLGKL